MSAQLAEMGDDDSADQENRRRRADPLASFLAAAAQAEPAPCDDCRKRDRCAAGLACAAFSLFVIYGTRKRWDVAPRDPSSAVFARLFRDD